VQTTEVLLNKP